MEYFDFVTPPSLRLLDMISSYLQHHYAHNDLSDKTKRNMDSFIVSIEEYLKRTRKPDLCIGQVNLEFMDELIIYLKSKGGSTNCSRAVSLVVKTMDFCKKRNHIEFNPVHDVKVKRGNPKEVVCLEKNELEKLICAHSEEKELEIVKDLYLFQCFTGISYGDLWTIKIIKDSKGEWIYNKRAKNRNEYYVPLIARAKEILIRYNYRLPKVSNVRYNERLRKLAKSINITKHLTTHTARKTFATDMFDNKGMSVESIAYMMGHYTPETTIKHYLRRSRNRLEMEASEKLRAFM